jgi:hypothetical protein
MLMPRLREMPGRAGRYDTVSDAALVASWRLGDGSTLELRLNLSDRAERASAGPQGKLLHCEPGPEHALFAKGELPPNAAAVYLKVASSAN